MQQAIQRAIEGQVDTRDTPPSMLGRPDILARREAADDAAQTVRLGGAGRAGAATGDAEDAALLQAVAAGVPTALEQLYTRHCRAVYALAYCIVGDASLADDVVQDAFLTIWRQAVRFDLQRGTPQVWISLIVRHRAIDALRRLKGCAGAGAALLDQATAADSTDIEQETLLRLDRQRVRAAMSALPPAQRHTVELAYFGGLTHHQIATHLDLPLGTVKGRLRLALRKLHDSLGDGQAAALAY